MKYLIGLTLFLALGSVAEAGGCYSTSYVSYATPSYYYNTGVYPTAYGDRFFIAGNYYPTSQGWFRVGYGIDYGIPVVQLAAVPLVAPAVAAYPQQQMPQQMQQGQQRQLTPSQVDKVIQLLEYLEQPQKTQTPPPATGN